MTLIDVRHRNQLRSIEAINILLDAKYCVFVIGMDSQTVAGSIEAKYKDLRDYLKDVDDPGGLTLEENSW